MQRIKKYSFIKKEHHKCIVVSDPSHLYHTSNNIVTHNSAMTSYSQPYDSLVQRADGTFIEIGFLKIGDALMPTLSNESKVTNIFEQGEQDTYELDFGNNIKTRCSLGHWWLLFDTKEKKYVVLQTKDFIKDKERYLVPEEEDIKRDADLIKEANRVHESLLQSDQGIVIFNPQIKRGEFQNC